MFALNTEHAVVNPDVFERSEQGMRIIVCDQQRMLAEAMAFALAARGYHVLAVSTTVSDAFSAAGACRPDVCLLGLQPAGQQGGPDAVRAILRRYPGTKVLVLSEVTDPETLSQLMKSGAAGLTHRDQSVTQTIAALNAIEAGRNVLDPGFPRVPARGKERPCELSPREREILARIASGQSTRQMSSAMDITVDTVRTYVKNVLAKLGVHSRLQLAALVSRDGSLIGQAPAADVIPLADKPVSRPRREPLPEGQAAALRRRWLAVSVPSAPPRIYVLIVDQQLAFRDALATRLQAEPGLEVVAKAHSAEFAPRVLVGRSTNVILLDAELPDGSANAFCAQVMQRADAPRVVMLSAASTPERIVAALRAGAGAWVQKDESIDHLLRVIRGVVHGEAWLPPRELRSVLRLLIEDQDDRRDRDSLLAALTPRERDVLFHLADGAGRQEVAERLQLSANTIRTHLHSLMAKLGVHSTLEAVALARPRLDALPEIREPHRSTPRNGNGPPGSSRATR